MSGDRCEGNPDYGLKNRNYVEAASALHNVVARHMPGAGAAVMATGIDAGPPVLPGGFLLLSRRCRTVSSPSEASPSEVRGRQGVTETSHRPVCYLKMSVISAAVR
jgi:hypothetical protein